MSEKLEELGNKLHTKLDSGINKLKGTQDRLGELQKDTKTALNKSLEAAKKTLDEKKQEAKKAKEKVEDYVEGKKAETKAAVSEWKTERNLKKLEKRAEKAEKHAESCIELTLYYSQEAEIAILEALAARVDLEEAIEDV